jgi:arylformamidase
VRIEPVKRLAAGGTSNTSLLHLHSHVGTHVDAPRHFFPDGMTISDLPIDAFVFDRPAVLDLHLGESDLVEPGDLEQRHAMITNADLLILRSGFESTRADHERYEKRGPGFSVGAARYIRQSLPLVRGIAVDWISLSAWAHVDEGRAAHRILLGDEPSGTPVLIFEDVHAAALGGAAPKRVLAFPLRITGLDGCPCTIVAEI